MKLAVKVSRSKLASMGGLLAEAMSELLGTFLFLLIIFLSPIMVRSVEPFILGTSIVALMMVFGAFSKPHLNPVFTFAEYFTTLPEQIKAKKFSVTKLWEMLMYLMAQLIGGLLAFALAYNMQGYLLDVQIEANGLTGTEGIREQFISQISYTTTFLTQFSATAFAIEMLFAFILAFAFLATSLESRSKGMAAGVVGLLTFSLTVFATEFTGASFHPFRSLVPALFAGGDAWGQVWLYIWAPITGALLAALAFLGLKGLKQLKKSK
jgi:aquaporin Z